MPTTVVKTIGTVARDYSTLQTWEDAAPASLVTADEIWQGQLYNDAEITGTGTLLTLSGSTSDATRYMELTTGSGQSFKDAANVRTTNTLKYNQANGVAIRVTGNYGKIIASDSNGFFRCSNIQFKGDGASSTVVKLSATATMRDCIVTVNANSLTGVDSILTCVNVLVFMTNVTSGGSTAFSLIGNASGGGLLVNCAAIRTTDHAAAGTAYSFLNYSSVIMKNCASFGFTTIGSGATRSASSSNNATDLSTGMPGSSNQYNVTFSSSAPFVNSTVASQNSKAVAATALDANGALDATNAPNDISGFARPLTPTIGPWELVGGAPPPYVAKHRMTG